MTKVDIAKIIAEAVHSGQKYGATKDYTEHLEDVKNILIRFNYTDEDLLCGAYLHDSVEDTKLKLSFIEKHFGTRVMKMVFAVTDEVGANRKERKLKTLPKIAANEDGIILKLADRIANLESGALSDMYKEENEIFKAFLYRDSEKAMWDHIEYLLNKK